MAVRMEHDLPVGESEPAISWGRREYGLQALRTAGLLNGVSVQNCLG